MKTRFLTTCLLLGFGVTCFGETLEGYVMPSKCKNDEPAGHTVECARACQSSGFGVVTADGGFTAFTAEGNKKALAMIEAASKTADLRVSVQGTRKGALLVVESIVWK